MTRMSRLLVILHIFYHGQVDYFIGKLKNISSCEWDLVVSYSSYSALTEEKLRAFRPDVTMVEVENVGYDVWPFIKIVRQIDASEYDFVLKLHSKNSNPEVNKINGLRMTSFRWRDLLVDSLLKSPRQFRKCLRLLEKNPKVGLVCAYELYKEPSDNLPEDTGMLHKEIRRIGIHRAPVRFCAGTMFMARLDALGRIRRSKITMEMWGHHCASHSTGSYAHVYERILCLMVKDAGYTIKNVITNPMDAMCVFLHNRLGPVLKFIFSLNREGPERIKYLTVMGFKFKLKG